MKAVKTENYWNTKASKRIKIYMTNKNLTDEEIKILKKQGRFTKLPYMGPKELYQTIK